MEKNRIKELIKKDPYFQDFVKNDKGQICITIARVPIVIFKENTGAGYYYRLPYDSSYNYTKVSKFMNEAIPILSELIEEERKKKILITDCLPPAR